MNSGKYIFQGESAESVLPFGYGFSTIKWGFDGAKQAIDTLKANDVSCTGLISKMIENPFLAELQYMALIIASHFVYATYIRPVPPNAVEEVLQGLGEGMKQLRLPSGEAYDDEVTSFLKSSIGKYHKALVKDFEGGMANDFESNLTAFNADGSEIAKAFIDMLSQAYRHNITEVDDTVNTLTLLNRAAMDIVSGVYQTLSELDMQYQHT